MTGPTETGHIIAYLSLDDTEWQRTIVRAKQDLRALARSSPTVTIRVDDSAAMARLALLERRLRDIEGAGGGNGGPGRQINFSTNARDQSVQISLLRDSIISVGSALIPLAGVAGGALAGAIPAVLSLALGIKGISDEMKSGALEGTEYAGDISKVKSEITDLKAISAQGLLNGLHEGLANADPLFKVVNSDTQVMSSQLGSIAQHGVPALLTLLTQLNPLFVTFGDELVRGAQGLENWTQSSNGVRGFVSYVQSELPAVEHTVGSLVESVVRLSQAAGPLGHITLTALGLIADGLNAIPLPVLQTLVPLLVAVRVSTLAYAGVSAVLNGVSASYTRLAGTAQAFGAQSIAGNLEVTASARAAAAAKASSDLTAAESALNAARVQEGATDAFIAAKAREVAAARAAAIQTSAAAEASAERTVAAGRVAASGYASALGPIGALMVGLTLLGGAFLGQSHSSEEATKANQAFADSVTQSTDAMSQANVQAAVKQLSDDHAYSNLQKLTTGFGTLSASQSDLVTAVNGTGEAYDQVIGKLEDYKRAATLAISDPTQENNSKKWSDQVKAVSSLIDTLGTLHKSLGNNIEQQNLVNKAMAAAKSQYSGGSAASQQMASSLGMQASAYLTAAAAAKKSTDQANAQTQAWQAENDAMSLLGKAFDELNGKSLDVYDARIAQAQAIATLTDGLKKNAGAWSLNTDAGRTNQQNVDAAIRSAQDLGKAVSGGTKLTTAGKNATLDALAAEKQRLTAMGASKHAIDRVSQAIADLANMKVPPVAIDTNTAPATDKISALETYMKLIRQGSIPGVTVKTSAGQALIAQLQAEIDALRNKTVVISVKQQGGVDGPTFITSKNAQGQTITHKAGYASGGLVRGPGTGTSDTAGLYALSDREFISTAAATGRNQSALEAANRGAKLAVVGMATGGKVGKSTKATQSTLSGDVDTAISAIGQAPASPQIDLSNTTIPRVQQQITHVLAVLDAQIAAGLSSKTATDARARINALVVEANKALANLRVKVNTQDLAAITTALSGTADDLKTAFDTLFADAKAAGLTPGQIDASKKKVDGYLTDLAKQQALLGTQQDNSETAYQKLADVQQQIASTAQSITQAITQGFDLASSGKTNGAVDLQGALLRMQTGGPQADGDEQALTSGGADGYSVAQSSDALAQQLASAKQIQADAKKLTALGLNTLSPALMAKILSDGSVSEADAFANLTKGQLAAYAANFNQLQKVAVDTGTSAANDIGAAQLTAAQQTVTSLQTLVNNDKANAKAQARQLSDLVAATRNVGGDVGHALQKVAGSAHNNARGARP